MHKPFKHIIPDANTAVLFVHGILGSPDHFTPLLPLVPPDVSVSGILLDGHGSSVQEFSRSSMEIWQAQVLDAVRELKATHRRICIVAHSMGTLLALCAASESADIDELLLLALPIRLRIRPRLLSNITKVFLNRIRPEDKAATASRDACSITLSKNLFLYLGWIPRYLELFQKISQTRKLLSRIQIPTTVFQSASDEMVSPISVPYLKQASNFHVHLLHDSEHYRYAENDLAQIKNCFQAMMDRNK